MHIFGVSVEYYFYLCVMGEVILLYPRKKTCFQIFTFEVCCCSKIFPLVLVDSLKGYWKRAFRKLFCNILFWHSLCGTCLILCVILFPLLVNGDKSSATIFFFPGIYSISQIYSSIINFHSKTLFECKQLCVRFGWLVHLFNLWPNNIVWG